MKKIGAVFALLLLFPALALAAAAYDPVQIGTSARFLGLGKSFVAVADDSTAVFVNPAGLSQLNTWQVGSMVGKHLNEYNQTVFSCALPADFGTLGFGFTSYSIGVSIPSLEVVEGLPFPVFTGDKKYDFGTNVYLLSYSRAVDFISPQLYGGATFKLYTGNFSGSDIPTLTASGMDLDLGVLYRINPGLQLGLSAQSILPMSMGGKLHWSDNTDESIPADIKAGFRVKPRDDLSVSLDGDLFPTQSGYPPLLHLGAEWRPALGLAWLNAFSLRAGVDQGFREEKTVNNTSLGIGLSYGGFGFDYAYHTYFEVEEFTSHYFSFSYTPPERKPVKKEYFRLIGVSSRETVYADRFDIPGMVLDGDVDRITMNGQPVSILKDNTFKAQAPLSFGGNPVTFEARDRNGALLKAIALKIVRLKTFKDVPLGYWAKREIEELATVGIITGYPDETFRPEGTITRAELCTLLIKSQAPSAKSQTIPKFKDLSSKHWAVDYIAQAVEKNVVKGYPDGTFRPNGNITRAEGVSVVARFAGLAAARLEAAPFLDVPGRHWAVESITAAKEAGLLDFLAGRAFEPSRSLTRAETAYILWRTSFVKKLVDF